ncbi:MAG: radical SAM family heme chaperone HemW [Intestinibacter bartlettii]|uniref:radical SAM family heme chaperone HemW n=1 Tax=Intestinibacter bartlettii TaxID=261299 RepID=UPI0026EEDFD0|nr:radical SAM family heme chaperone HemW [Intestinibacter bartlettii]MDO5010772.1 radical SAM family heme chaperone HemW [Intestinibacter bartlettii]
MLGLYIHIPFCVQKCKYCDFNSYKMIQSEKNRFLSDLKKEMALYKNKDRKINSIFFGGGTPSILNNQEIKMIMDEIKQNFCIDEDAEISMECNPGTLNEEKLKFMKSIGINRLSIGLQAVQENLLGYIGRIHNYNQFEKNYFEARKAGFENINIDLMYNLPHQTFEDWKETLHKIVDLNPEHISAYSLILEEGTKLYEMYMDKEFDLGDEDEDIKMYEYTIDYLKSNGYNQYEISNYAKMGYECKHNILYWKCKNYIGLGPGASGYINNVRYNNVKSLQDYHEKLSGNEKPIDFFETLTEKDKIEEKIIMGLRMNEGIIFKDFEEFNLDFTEKYKEQLKRHLELELIEMTQEGFKFTQKGREISNNIFLDYID